MNLATQPIPRELGINGEPVQRLLRRVTSAEFVSLRG